MSDQSESCALPLSEESIAALRSAMPIMHAAMSEAKHADSLSAQLMLLMGSRLSIGVDEVKRREQIFVYAATSGTHLLGSPRIAALESVLDDVRAGRLR